MNVSSRITASFRGNLMLLIFLLNLPLLPPCMVDEDCIRSTRCCLATFVFSDYVNFASNSKLTFDCHADGNKTLVQLTGGLKKSSEMT